MVIYGKFFQSILTKKTIKMSVILKNYKKIFILCKETF